jgi:hypothetical protein
MIAVLGRQRVVVDQQLQHGDQPVVEASVAAGRLDPALVAPEGRGSHNLSHSGRP